MTTFTWDTARPLVMGILNVTPDSFTDGGQFADPARAIAHGWAMARAGADILDIGGESTRPGAVPVSADEELARVLPVMEGLAAAGCGSGLATGAAPAFCLSVDTTKAIVAERALAAGARIVNDISALRFDPRMIEVVRNAGAGLVLMHMRGTPPTMQQEPRYADVVGEVRAFLAERVAFAESCGLEKKQIAVDPGIGFGKTVEQNLELLARLDELGSLDCAVLVGASRKSFLGRLLGRETPARLAGSLAVAAWALTRGAQVLRVHDVAESVDVVRLVQAVQRAR